MFITVIIKASCYTVCSTSSSQFRTLQSNILICLLISSSYVSQAVMNKISFITVPLHLFLSSLFSLLHAEFSILLKFSHLSIQFHFLQMCNHKHSSVYCSTLSAAFTVTHSKKQHHGGQTATQRPVHIIIICFLHVRFNISFSPTTQS